MLHENTTVFHESDNQFHTVNTVFHTAIPVSSTSIFRHGSVSTYHGSSSDFHIVSWNWYSIFSSDCELPWLSVTVPRTVIKINRTSMLLRGSRKFFFDLPNFKNASIWRHNVPYGTRETWNASIWRHNVPYFSTTKNMEVEYSFPSSNSYSMNQSRGSSILHGSRNHFHDRVWNITLTSMNAMELDLNFMEDRS